MRLICPGCAAQYEVQESAIPPEGRDVQCSNCGNAWFQRGPLPDGTLPRDGDAEILARMTAVARPSPARAGLGAATAPAGSAPAPSGDDDALHADEDEPAASAGAPPTARAHKIDESVLSVLREEAEREARARRADATSLESQPDLGLSAALHPQAAPRRPAVRTATISESIPEQEIAPRRNARPRSSRRGSDDAPEPLPPSDRAAMAEDDDIAGRRKRLPDIEEINSTLRGASDRGDAGALPTDAVIAARNARRGFRAGFTVVLLIVALALAVYVMARPIAAAVPALAPLLESYSAGGDALRLWLARQTEAGMRGLLAWIS